MRMKSILELGEKKNNAKAFAYVKKKQYLCKLIKANNQY